MRFCYCYCCMSYNQIWMELLNLGRLEAFKGIAQHFAKNLVHYRKYFDSGDPHRDPLAEGWDAKLSQFQKMLFLRCVRVDKALLAIAVCDINFINYLNLFVKLKT